MNYGRTIESPMFVALGKISAELKKTETWKALIQLIDYCVEYPNEKMGYTTSDMLICIHRDASYSSEIK